MTSNPRSARFFIRDAALFGILLAVSGTSLAQTGEGSNEKGYRDCNLQHLDQCQNTNQMFVGLGGKGWSSSYRKPQLPAAIERFMRGTPRIEVLNYSLSASEIAEESLEGPGSRFHLPSGEWLFTGFTPHAAPDQAAIVFDATGRILLIATLQPDMSVPPKGAYGGYPQKLVIYLHEPTRETRFIERLVRWARDSVSERNRTYTELPKDEMGTIKIVTASKDRRQWYTRLLQ